MTIDTQTQLGEALALLSEFMGELAEHTTDQATLCLLESLGLLLGGIDHAIMTTNATTTLVSAEHRDGALHVVAMPFRLE
jgi:hypothetical protein